MSYIKWLEVEGVRYEGLGDSISCQTAVGFHSQLPGMRLEDLEISDVHGSTLGYLTADFTTGHLVIAPVVSAAELASTLEIPSFLETQIIPSVRVYKRCCFR